ncbi:MAG TPA: histidine kinase dimerization/phosphoacceptor domain -containing protein, partial [Chryseolinea sp.]|nr:histidine kinase dimerization/phosphoacceptor domain -containing protein [Chryseolinea sp.]
MERSFAQLKSNQTSSALISALQKDNPDSVRLQLLLQLSLHNYFEGDDNRKTLDSIFTFLQQAEIISNEIHFLKWQPEIFCFLGKYYYKIGNLKQADDYFRKTKDYIDHLGPVKQQAERWHELALNIEELDTIGLTRINCFEKMASLYAQSGDKEDQLDVERNIADTHMKQGKLDLAELELSNALAKYKAIGSPNIFYCYNLLSVTNHLKGNYNKALYYALQTIENMHNTSNAWSIIFYSHVANLYDELGQTGKSIEYYRIVFKIDHPVPVDFYYIREAGIFVRDLIDQNKQEEAHTFLIEFSKKYPPSDPYGKASLAETFAYYYNSVHNYNQAERYTREMISLGDSLGKNNEIRRDVEFDIGRYYYGKKQFEKAATHFHIALDEAMLNNSANTIRDIDLLLFKTDSSLGNYFSAIKYLNQYHQLNDSMFNVAKTRQVKEVQIKYETEKKEKDIQLLENEGRLQQNKLIQAGYTRNWILGGMILLLITIGLLVRNARLKQRTNRKLRLQQKEIGEQNIALRHLVNEKEWLVKEIHHRVKNNFQTVMGLLGTQTIYLKDEVAIDAISDGQHRIHAMSLIHQKLYQTENMSAINMADYINELVDYLRDSFTVTKRIRFNLQIQRIELDLSHCIPLGLILNEAITNSIKYAFPDRREGLIFISLKKDPAGQVLLSIEDNGVGLPEGFTAARQDSMGMNLMRGLCAEITAKFSLQSQ